MELWQICACRTSPVVQWEKNLPAMQEMRAQSLGQKDPLGKDIATHSNILARKIPWTEDGGGLQYVYRIAKSQIPLSNWAHTHTHTYTRQIDFIFLSMHPQILSSPCISIFCPKQSIQFVLQSKACRRLSLSLNHVKSHHSTPVTLLSTYFCHLVLSISISALTLLDLALPISDLCPEPASYLVSLPLT